MTGPDGDSLIDISVPYDAAVPVWEGDTPFGCTWRWRTEQGHSVNLGVITTSAHAGTHADAPLHVHAAWGASESLPPDAFVGPVVVLALPDAHAPVGPIEVPTLEAMLATALAGAQWDGTAAPRLLVHTGRSVAGGTFPAGWPALSEAAAGWLVARGLRLFGTDAPSVDARTSTTLPVHHALFAGGACVLENLALDHVTPGRYDLLAQPVAMVGADAAPVRALLRQV